MKKLITIMASVLALTVFCSGFVFAANSDMKDSNMAASHKFGDLIHESVVEGYSLSYYLMDLRKHKGDNKNMEGMDGSQDMNMKEMKKPHHIMVYIMDKNHQPVIKGKVGFLIKNSAGDKQKAMGMSMGKGFGTTADLKQKGIYTIAAKAVFGEVKLMDLFTYEIK